MPQGTKYYVYPAAILKVIKSYIKLHITITEKGIIKIQTENKDTREGSLQPNKVIAWVGYFIKPKQRFQISPRSRKLWLSENVVRYDIDDFSLNKLPAVPF